MTRRIFLDTEWTAPPWSKRSELMWVGLADEDGHSWYGISSEVLIDPTTNKFLSAVFEVITPDEPRLTRKQIAATVLEFCAEVDEFWAWVPTLDRFKAFSGLRGDAALQVFKKFCDVDLQMLQGLIQPWPAGWPDQLSDLNAVATAASVKIPDRPENFLHPRVHAEWNRDLFELIRTSGLNDFAGHL